MPFSFCLDFNWRKANNPCDVGALRRSIKRMLLKITVTPFALPNAVLRIWLFSDDPLALWQLTSAETAVVAALQDAAILNGGHVAELHCYNARSGILPERLECVVDVSYP